MKTLGPAVKVGVTFVVAVALGYYSFMMLAKGSCAGEEEGLVVHAFFRDATGLVEKSRVQIAGLNVGHIVSRELNVRPPRQDLIASKRFAKITISLSQGVTLYTNAKVYKRSASLLGEFYLEIDPGTHDWVDASGKIHRGEKLETGDEITRVFEAVTTDSLIRQVSNVVPVLKDIASDIRKFTRGPLHAIARNVNDGISENRANVKRMLENMEAITRDVRSITGGADDKIDSILIDIKAITGSVRELVGTGDKEVKSTASKLKEGLDKLAGAIDKLDSALGNVQNITQDVEDGKGTVGRLLKDETLINDVEETVRDAGGFIRSLTELQTIVGLRTEFNFLSNSIKTYVSVEIRPRPDKYYLIELVDDPRGVRTITSRLTRSDDPSQPVVKREDVVEISDAFRFSFQFAKRTSLATFRFGIKESTGGVGLDFHLLGDRVRIESDLFDFSANVWPRVKVLAAWEFFKRLYVVGGVDDILNDRPLDGAGGGRDYFAGVQLRFTDDDLKSLLLFGGGMVAGASK